MKILSILLFVVFCIADTDCKKDQNNNNKNAHKINVFEGVNDNHQNIEKNNTFQVTGKKPGSNTNQIINVESTGVNINTRDKKIISKVINQHYNLFFKNKNTFFKKLYLSLSDKFKMSFCKKNNTLYLNKKCKILKFNCYGISSEYLSDVIKILQAHKYFDEEQLQQIINEDIKDYFNNISCNHTFNKIYYNYKQTPKGIIVNVYFEQSESIKVSNISVVFYPDLPKDFDYQGIKNCIMLADDDSIMNLFTEQISFLASVAQAKTRIEQYMMHNGFTSTSVVPEIVSNGDNYSVVFKIYNCENSIRKTIKSVIFQQTNDKSINSKIEKLFYTKFKDMKYYNEMKLHTFINEANHIFYTNDLHCVYFLNMKTESDIAFEFKNDTVYIDDVIINGNNRVSDARIINALKIELNSPIQKPLTHHLEAFVKHNSANLIDNVSISLKQAYDKHYTLMVNVEENASNFDMGMQGGLIENTIKFDVFLKYITDNNLWFVQVQKNTTYMSLELYRSENKDNSDFFGLKKIGVEIAPLKKTNIGTLDKTYQASLSPILEFSFPFWKKGNNYFVFGTVAKLDCVYHHDIDDESKLTGLYLKPIQEILTNITWSEVAVDIMLNPYFSFYNLSTMKNGFIVTFSPVWKYFFDKSNYMLNLSGNITYMKPFNKTETVYSKIILDCNHSAVSSNIFSDKIDQNIGFRIALDGLQRINPCCDNNASDNKMNLLPFLTSILFRPMLIYSKNKYISFFISSDLHYGKLIKTTQRNTQQGQDDKKQEIRLTSSLGVMINVQNFVFEFKASWPWIYDSINDSARTFSLDLKKSK